jgi:hypothetical protein
MNLNLSKTIEAWPGMVKTSWSSIQLLKSLSYAARTTGMDQANQTTGASL